MQNQTQSASPTPAGQLKRDLLTYAAHRRQKMERHGESTDLTWTIKPESTPGSRGSIAPTWSALHD